MADVSLIPRAIIRNQIYGLFPPSAKATKVAWKQDNVAAYAMKSANHLAISEAYLIIFICAEDNLPLASQVRIRGLEWMSVAFTTSKAIDVPTLFSLNDAKSPLLESKLNLLNDDGKYATFAVVEYPQIRMSVHTKKIATYEGNVRNAISVYSTTLYFV